MKKILIAFLLLTLPLPAHADPVMDRINKDQKIRCGYISYTPGSTKDATTGKMTGFNADLMEEATRRMGLGLEWTYETNWPTIATDLQTGKFDLACLSYWSNPRSARQMLGTNPVFYQPVFFVTRIDDKRFDKNISKVNDPAVSVGVLEGDVPETIVRELYPKAKIVALSQSTSFGQVYQEVVSKRADVTIASKPDMDGFEEANPGKLKIILDQPVRLFPAVLLMPPGAVDLQSALNITIREMQLDGTVEKIMKKHAKGPHDYYMINLPYSKIKGVKE